MSTGEEKGRGGEVMIATDSRILALPRLHCPRYRYELNTAMWNLYQNIRNRI